MIINGLSQRLTDENELASDLAAASPQYERQTSANSSPLSLEEVHRSTKRSLTYVWLTLKLVNLNISTFSTISGLNTWRLICTILALSKRMTDDKASSSAGRLAADCR